VQVNEKETYLQTSSLTRSSTTLLVNEIQNQANVVVQQSLASKGLIESKVSLAYQTTSGPLSS
jgi:hypothetical protein